MGDSVDRLIALSVLSKVRSYKRKSKTGKIVDVEAYTRSIRSMNLPDLKAERVRVAGDRTKRVVVDREIAARRRASPTKKPVPQRVLTQSKSPVERGGNAPGDALLGPLLKSPVFAPKTAPVAALKVGAPKKKGKKPTPEMDKIPHGVKGKGTATGTIEDPINCAGNVVLAAKLIQEGKHVRLNRVDEVGTLLDRLNEIAQQAKAKGAKAPIYNLCLVSVPKTNLFCAGNKGITRDLMPQLGGEAVPGTKADKLPRVRGGEVDITEQFREELESRGIKVTEKSVPAASLKATQTELIGAKVAGIMRAMEKAPENSPLFDAIFVTRDNYVIDGHHRWAAEVGLDAHTGNLGNVQMKVRMIDMEIGEAIDFANAYAKDYGIAQKGIDAAPDVITPASKTTATAMDRLKTKR